MATPAMLPTNVNFDIIPGNAGQFRVNTLAADGSALDVSSGYTLGKLTFVPSNDANPQKAAQDLDANVSAAFDATGVDISFTAAQASTLAAALYTSTSSVGVLLTNDSGTTHSLAATGTANVRQDKQLQ